MFASDIYIVIRGVRVVSCLWLTASLFSAVWSVDRGKIIGKKIFLFHHESTQYFSHSRRAAYKIGLLSVVDVSFSSVSLHQQSRVVSRAQNIEILRLLRRCFTIS